MVQTANFALANDAGAAVRARINEIVAALQSTSAGASAPSATVAGMLWVDTAVSPPVLRRRNATNTGWDALLDAAGNLYFSETGAGRIRRVSADEVACVARPHPGGDQALSRSGGRCRLPQAQNRGPAQSPDRGQRHR